jgi:hypothetical protein
VGKLIDLSGKKFGMLTVIKRNGTDNSGKAKWLCSCECGNTTSTTCDSLIHNNTKSCGCLKRTCHIKHSKCESPEYNTWESMIQRCNNPNSDEYKNYGGRGIIICEDWQSFEKFFADMGERPKGLSIDRIDNDGNYCKENCRWATREEQSNNTSRTVFYEHDGKVQSITQWAREYNISRTTFDSRLKRGILFEEAIDTSFYRRMGKVFQMNNPKEVS